MTSSRPSWMLPVLAVALTAVAGAVALHQMDRSLDQLELGFAAHARSVARLVDEGARQATAALDLVYDLSEQELAHAAWRLSRCAGREACRAVAEEEALVAWWSASGADDTGLVDARGEQEQAVLRQQVLAAAPGELVEDGAAAIAGLYCVRGPAEGAAALACRDLAELQALRRDTGLGLLLSSAVGEGVRYVALQDGSGILAASSDLPALTTWPQDPALASTVREARMRFRPRPGTPPLLEGLSPFALPDGSTAVLRIGVDATVLTSARAQLAGRQRVLLGVLLGLVLVALGATGALQRQERARQHEAQALQAREAAARHWQTIGEMAATVAHEVRNPLNTLGMIGQRLRREFAVPAGERVEYEQLLSVLHDEAERVNRVVSEFLELGKPLQLARSRVSLRPLLDEAAAPLVVRGQAEGKQLLLVVEADGAVDVDRQRVTQILHNLVGNALDAVGAGGAVTVRAAQRDGTLHLTVDDDGPGMDPQALARAQQPFATTKARGTGLGLSIVRRLAEAHGGELILQSTSGQGTRAEVRLPPSARWTT